MPDIFETIGFFVLDNWKILLVALVLLAAGVAVLYPNISLESKNGTPAPTTLAPPVTTVLPTTTPPPVTTAPPTTTPPPVTTVLPTTTPAPTTTAPPTTTPPPPVTTVPPSTLLLEILNQQETYGPNGEVYLNGTVRNNWTSVVYEVRVSSTFYDKNGNILVTMIRSPMEKLKPGASFSFKISSGHLEAIVDHYTITATSPTIIPPTSTVVSKIEAEIINKSEELTSGGKLVIKGEIKNIGEDDLNNVQVFATFYDKYEKEIDWIKSIPITKLSPTETHSFTLESELLRTNIASYKLETLSN